MENDPPLIAQPKAEPSAAVIWLHGLGADGYDFAPIIPQLTRVRNHTRFVFPHAPLIPVTLNQGFVMRAWYDLALQGDELLSDEAGVRESQAALEALVEAQHGSGLPYTRIVLAGFSQGGAIAQHTALRFPHRLAGVMALSTYLPLGEKLASERHRANANVPIFMAHGLHDPMIGVSRAEESRARLVDLGYQVDWNTYRMEHSVCPDEIIDIDGWLATVIPA